MHDRRIGDGFVLGIDRSVKAIALAMAGSGPEMTTGRLSFRQVPGGRLFIDGGDPLQEVPLDAARRP